MDLRNSEAAASYVWVLVVAVHPTTAGLIIWLHGFIALGDKADYLQFLKLKPIHLQATTSSGYFT